MTEILQLRVDGTRLTIEELPFSAMGTCGVTRDDAQYVAQSDASNTAHEIACAVTFDAGWDGFTRTLLLRHRGEAPLAMTLKSAVRKGKNKSDRRMSACILPTTFLEDDRPILLAVEGAQSAEQTGGGGSRHLRTNDVCAALRNGSHGEKPIRYYEGPYTLRENKTYSLADTFLPQDLTVDVPTVDLTGDTVTPETLWKGVTAHNAAGEAIVGTHGGMNLVCSMHAPEDTGKLWIQTAETPEKMTVDRIRPVWQTFCMRGNIARMNILHWMADTSGYLYAYGVEQTDSGYRPHLLRFSPDGGAEQISSGKRLFPSLLDAQVLDGCVGQEGVYLLLGASEKDGGKRPVRLYRFDRFTGGQVCKTVDNNGYFALSGGVTEAEDGDVCLYISASAAAGETRFFRAYRFCQGELTQVSEQIDCRQNGGGGMAKIGGIAYTPVHTDDGEAISIDLLESSIGTWRLDKKEGVLRIDGAAGDFLQLRYPYGVRIIRPQTGETAKINFCTAGGDLSQKRCYHAWAQTDAGLFVISTDRGTLQYAVLPTSPSGTELRLICGEEEGVRLPVYRMRGQTIYAEVSNALVSNGDGEWTIANGYLHDGTSWKRVL